MFKQTAITFLVDIINSGNLSEAREWATDNESALFMLRQADGMVAVAHACNRWGASMVWPWGDMPRPTAAQQRLIFRLRTNAQGWNCNEDTFAVCLAFGWIRKNESGQLESV